MKITGLQIFYGVLAVVGFFVTWYYNLQPRENGFIADMYANSASTSIANDLNVVVVMFLVWSFIETSRRKMSRWLWAVGSVLTFIVAAAVTFPLFLLIRERRLNTVEESST